MKYRIVPCIGTKIYYKIQIKKFIFWRDHGYCDDYGYGSVSGLYEYSTIKLAQEDMIENHGESAKQFDFNLA